MFRPQETVQKLLFSSPARYISEYETSGFVLTHAWRFSHNAMDEQSPLTRSIFILSFKTPEIERAVGVAIPNYLPIGEYMCAILAVLFGKRFDHHGAVEMTGNFHVPDLSQTGELCEQSRPYHGKRLRADYPIPLDLREFVRFICLTEQQQADGPLREAFNTAALFHARALRAIGHDPEVAYLHLITACERLAEVAPLSEIELEAVIAAALSRVEREMVDGDRIVRLFRQRMRHLKRRFVGLLSSHVDDAFFGRTEAQSVGALSSTGFTRTAAAAYDLRSRYVHTGAAFGNWIAPRFNNPERQYGKPVVADRELAKILARAPTFIGLERITRVVLLKCAERLGAELPSDSAENTRATDGSTKGQPGVGA